LIVQFRIKTENQEFRSITNNLKLNPNLNNALDEFIIEIQGNWELKCDEYKDLGSIVAGIFVYKTFKDKIHVTSKSKLEIDPKGIYKNSHKVNGYELPNTIDISKWGTEIIYNEQRTLATICRFKGQSYYEIHIHPDHNIVHLKRNNHIISS
jgi:hypothetical protein